MFCDDILDNTHQRQDCKHTSWGEGPTGPNMKGKYKDRYDGGTAKIDSLIQSFEPARLLYQIDLFGAKVTNAFFEFVFPSLL